MLAVRAKARDLRVLELRQADAALVDRLAEERELELRTTVLHAPPLEADASRGRDFERRGINEEGVLRRVGGCCELGDAQEVLQNEI